MPALYGYFDPRKITAKFVEPRRQPTGTEDGANGNRHGRSCFREATIDLAQDRLEGLLDNAAQGLPGFCQHHLSCLADKEQAVPVAFQLADLVTDSR